MTSRKTNTVHPMNRAFIKLLQKLDDLRCGLQPLSSNVGVLRTVMRGA